MIGRIDSTDPTAFDAWYTAMRAAVLVDRDPRTASVLSPDTLRGVLSGHGDRDRRGQQRAQAYAAHGEEGAIVGPLLLEFSDRDDLHLAGADVNVTVGARRRGHGTRILEHAERVIADEGRVCGASRPALAQHPAMPSTVTGSGVRPPPPGPGRRPGSSRGTRSTTGIRSRCSWRTGPAGR